MGMGFNGHTLRAFFMDFGFSFYLMDEFVFK